MDKVSKVQYFTWHLMPTRCSILVMFEHLLKSSSLRRPVRRRCKCDLLTRWSAHRVSRSSWIISEAGKQKGVQWVNQHHHVTFSLFTCLALAFEWLGSKRGLEIRASQRLLTDIFYLIPFYSDWALECQSYTTAVWGKNSIFDRYFSNMQLTLLKDQLGYKPFVIIIELWYTLLTGYYTLKHNTKIRNITYRTQELCLH